PAADDLAAADEDGTNGESALGQARAGFVDGGLEERVGAIAVVHGGMRSEVGGGRLGFGRVLIFLTDQVVDFFAMDANFTGGVNAQAHFVAANIDDRNDDVVADDDGLIFLPREYEHNV